LLAIFASLLSLLFFPKRGLALSRPELSDEEILRQLLDVLIPSDSTPGANEAKVYEKLAVLIAVGKKKKKAYQNGLAMIRDEIKKTAGDTVDWNAVIERITSTRFFFEFKTDAMRLFYSDPVSWKSISYDGPQLSGFYDYHRCE
jgi:hypothetical protein